MMVKIETRGVEETREFFRNAALNLVRGAKTVTVSMAGERNQTIAAAQAVVDRNPFYLTSSESRILTSLIAGGLSDALSQRDRDAMKRTLQDVGDMMINYYQDHIHHRKSGGKPPVKMPASPHQTKPLSPEYAKWKRKKFGKSVPELIATGEFIGSMRAKVT